MQIKEWETWYTYTTYIDTKFLDLDKIQNLLLKYDIIESSYHSEDNCLIKEESHVKKIVVHRNKIYNKITLDLSSNENNYSIEGIYQSIQMKEYDKIILKGNLINQCSYFRAFLKPILLKNEKNILKLCPQIKIYYNGILIITYRVINSENGSLTTNKFISDFVNLFENKFDDVCLSPDLLYFYIKNDQRLDNSLLKNISDSKLKELLKETKEIDCGDFKFTLFSISNLLNYDEKLSLDIVNDIIMSSLEYLFFKKLAMKNIRIGEYWRGFPNNYIISFENQLEKKSDINKKFKSDINKIMKRSIYTTILEDYTKLDLRLNDEDYSVFVNEALSLWIFSKKGLKKYYHEEDINRSNLIYEREILIEAILFYHMTLCKFEFELMKKNISYRELLDQKIEINSYIANYDDISNFGELNHFYYRSLEEFKISKIKDNINELLNIKSEISKDKRDSKIKSIGLFLTLVFGLFSLPTFTEKFIIPLWSKYHLLLYNNEFILQIIVTILYLILIILSLIIYKK